MGASDVGCADRLHEVEKEIDADILARVAVLRDAQRRLAAVQVAAVLLAVAAAVLLARANDSLLVLGTDMDRTSARVHYSTGPMSDC